MEKDLEEKQKNLLKDLKRTALVVIFITILLAILFFINLQTDFLLKIIQSFI